MLVIVTAIKYWVDFFLAMYCPLCIFFHSSPPPYESHANILPIWQMKRVKRPEEGKWFTQGHMTGKQRNQDSDQSPCDLLFLPTFQLLELFKRHHYSLSLCISFFSQFPQWFWFICLVKSQQIREWLKTYKRQRKQESEKQSRVQIMSTLQITHYSCVK